LQSSDSQAANKGKSKQNTKKDVDEEGTSTGKKT
jgi:hypothetical protein